MNALPLIERELRLGARRPGTYWMRSGLAAAACVIWFLVLVASRNMASVHARALILFWTGTVLAFGFCLLAGMFLTADCVSAEKREGTLGLLFLTDLKSYDVVFGKLAATSLHAAYGLVAVLPLLSLPMLLGGVSLGEFWRSTLVLVTTLFLSLAIGLAVSTISREARQAMTATLGVLVGLAGILPLISWVAVMFLPGGKLAASTLLLASPPFGLALATDSLYSAATGARDFWAFLAVQAGLCVTALTFAGLRAPEIWTERQETETGSRGAGRWTLRYGGTRSRRRRQKWIGKNPFYWLATRDRLPLAFAWVVVGILFAIWLAFLTGWLATSGTKREVCFTGAAFVAYGAFVLGKSLVAIEAARRVSEDRHNGTLELMLVTPLAAEEIIAGQRGALYHIFLLPGLVVLFMNVFLLGMLGDWNQTGSGHEAVVIGIFFFAVGALLLKGDITALSYVGLWSGLRARRLHWALVEVLGRVMLVPWLGIVFFAVTLIRGVGLSAGEMFLLLFAWILISLMVDAVAGAGARDRLDHKFRQAACGDGRLSNNASGDVLSVDHDLARSA